MNRIAKTLTKHAAQHLGPGEGYEVGILATPQQPKYAPLLMAFGGLGMLVGQSLAKRRMKDLPADVHGTWAASLMTSDNLWLALTDSRLVAIRGNNSKPRELHVAFGLENILGVRRPKKFGSPDLELDLIDGSTVAFSTPTNNGLKDFVRILESRTVSA